MRTQTLENSEYRTLIETAVQSLDRAYTPYSGFQVGAALLDTNGKVWTGCNVESASFTPTSCAERSALFKAVSEGQQTFRAIAIVGRKEGESELTEDFAAPCGVCRQALVEFADPDFEIVLARRDGTVQVWTMEELLPLSFTRKNLKG